MGVVRAVGLAPGLSPLSRLFACLPPPLAAAGSGSSPLLLTAKNFERTHLFSGFIWCGQWDLNPHVVSNTRPSTVPVCQFQHARIAFFFPNPGSENKSAKVIIHYGWYNYKIRFRQPVYFFHISQSCAFLLIQLQAESFKYSQRAALCIA